MCRCEPLRSSGYGHMADGIGAEPAVHRTAGSWISMARRPRRRARQAPGLSLVGRGSDPRNPPAGATTLLISGYRSGLTPPGRSPRLLVCAWAAGRNDRPRINQLPAGRCCASFRRPLTDLGCTCGGPTMHLGMAPMTASGQEEPVTCAVLMTQLGHKGPPHVLLDRSVKRGAGTRAQSYEPAPCWPRRQLRPSCPPRPAPAWAPWWLTSDNNAITHPGRRCGVPLPRPGGWRYRSVIGLFVPSPYEQPSHMARSDPNDGKPLANLVLSYGNRWERQSRRGCWA